MNIYKEQEEQFVFTSFDNDEGSIMAINAMENNFPVAIDITMGTHLWFRYAALGTKEGTSSWLERKKRTVMLSKMSTIRYAEVLKQEEKTYEDMGFKTEDYVRCGGGFPITVNGEVVGTIAVSGMTDVEDHQIMIDGLTEF